MYKVLVIFLILGCAAENGGQFRSYDAGTVTYTATNTATETQTSPPKRGFVSSTDTSINTDTNTSVVVADGGVDTKAITQSVTDTQTLTSTSIVDAGSNDTTPPDLLIIADSLISADTEIINLCLHPELADTIGLDGGYSGAKNYTDVTGGACVDVMPPGWGTLDCEFLTNGGEKCTVANSICGFCKKICNKC